MSKSIEELFAEIERTDDRAIYAVLADALVERGDRRGELMQVQIALDGAAVDDPPPPRPRAFADRITEDLAREERPATLDRAAARELRVKAASLIEARTAELLAELPEHHGFTTEFRYG